VQIPHFRISQQYKFFAARCFVAVKLVLVGFVGEVLWRFTGIKVKFGPAPHNEITYDVGDVLMIKRFISNRRPNKFFNAFLSDLRVTLNSS